MPMYFEDFSVGQETGTPVRILLTVPLGKGSILPLALAAAAPMLIVVAMEVPLKTILLGILKALL